MFRLVNERVWTDVETELHLKAMAQREAGKYDAEIATAKKDMDEAQQRVWAAPIFESDHNDASSLVTP